MIPLVELTHRLGGLAWVSRKLFAIEGQRAGGATNHGAVHLSTHSRHHGWHAQLLAEAMPDSPALESAAHIVAPAAGWFAAVEFMDKLDDDDTVAVLVGLYRHLVPRALSGTTRLLADLTDPGDAAMRRSLEFVLADQQTDLAGGVGLLTDALGTVESCSRAAEVGSALDSLFLG